MYTTLGSCGAGRDERAAESQHLPVVLVVNIICLFLDRNATCKVLFSLLPPYMLMFSCGTLKYPLFPSARRKCVYHIRDSAAQTSWINLYLPNPSQEPTRNNQKRSNTARASACARAGQDHLSNPPRGSGRSTFVPRVWHSSPPPRWPARAVWVAPGGRCGSRARSACPSPCGRRSWGCRRW